MVMALLIVLPGLGIAAWLAFLFVSKRHYEKGVIAFLSTTLGPIVAWYVVQWIADVLMEVLYDNFYHLPPGTMYGSMPPLAQAIADVLEYLPEVSMVAAFVGLCIYWARRGQQLEAKTVAASGLAESPSPQVTPAPLQSVPESANANIRSRLEALEQLRRDGVLTNEEYAAKRAEIIAQL